MEKKFDKQIKGLWIDPLVFTQKFVKACDICHCSGECCYYGVYTDKKEHDKILEIKDRIIEFMDDSQTKDVDKWFEAPEKDDDFESGIAYGTEVHNGKCVFLDKQGFCTIQKVAVESQEFKWKYKPLYCILFPLVIYNGALTVDDEHLARMHYCSKLENQVSTVFDACKNELIYLLGEDGFQELDEYRKIFLNKNIKVKV
jgi:Fe-S-cluster containining protein